MDWGIGVPSSAYDLPVMVSLAAVLALDGERDGFHVGLPGDGHPFHFTLGRPEVLVLQDVHPIREGAGGQQ